MKNKIPLLQLIKEREITTCAELFKIPGVWIQRQMFGDYAPLTVEGGGARTCCLRGGLCLVYKDSRIRNALHAKIERSVKIGHIPAWNDSPNRTQEEVQALCEKLNI